MHVLRRLHKQDEKRLPELWWRVGQAPAQKELDRGVAA
jgi:hypothetical protein